MCTSSYGMSSARVSAMRSSSAPRLSSERTSWKISARRRYGSADSGRVGVRSPEGTTLICGTAAGSMGAGSDMNAVLDGVIGHDDAVLERCRTSPMPRSALVENVEDARRALLACLIDHAPLFPP